MPTISIGETVGKSYSFAFGRYFALVGVLWLPILILAAAGYFVVVPMMSVILAALQHAPQSGDGDFPFALSQNLAQFQLRSLAFRILELAAISVISVGVVKEALGLRKGWRFVYLQFGLEELLVAGAYFLLVIFVIAFIVAVAIAGGITALLVAAVVHSMSHGAMIATTALCAVAGVIAAVAAFIYLGVRLAFFVVPVTVCEREFGVFRSWELSKGHFWRILAVLLLTWLPIVIALYAIWGAVLAATVLPAILHAATAMGSHNAGLASEILRIVWASAQQNWPWLIALAVVPLPVVYGLTLSPGAFVYRQLIPAPETPAVKSV